LNKSKAIAMVSSNDRMRFAEMVMMLGAPNLDFTRDGE
jgi:hypothetical protein